VAEPFPFASEVTPHCQIGISSSIDDPEPDSWLDVSCYVHTCEIFRGRDRFTDRFEPGTASLTLSNTTGWADLVGIGDPIVAAPMRPGRPIRIGIVGPWKGLPPSVRWLYRGWIDQTTPRYDPVEHDVVDVHCVDSLGEAGSSTAPRGPMQGDNETVTARMNRILDSVEWPASKRKIDSRSTAVQGTELGSRAIDLMGQAADTDGGVVLGDTDGDVVFRGLNWMLYDPDTPGDLPPIGNVDPGTLPGGPPTPPYQDPTKGPVFDPTPPPVTGPIVLLACFNGTEGTLVEQGHSYRLYVEDGHAFFSSSGHYWDLGTVSIPADEVEVGIGVLFNPNTGAVQRVDKFSGPCKEPGDWVPVDEPPIPVPPPTLKVVFLGYSASGAAAGEQAGFTIPAMTAGADSLLVLVINAVGGTGDAEVVPNLPRTVV
jgi:hypothetical protein